MFLSSGIMRNALRQMYAGLLLKRRRGAGYTEPDDPLALERVLSRLYLEKSIQLSAEDRSKVSLEDIEFPVAKQKGGEKFGHLIPVVRDFRNIPDIEDGILIDVVRRSVVDFLDRAFWFFDKSFCEELLQQGVFVFLFYRDPGKRTVGEAILHFSKDFMDDDYMVVSD